MKYWDENKDLFRSIFVCSKPMYYELSLFKPSLNPTEQIVISVKNLSTKHNFWLYINIL